MMARSGSSGESESSVDSAEVSWLVFARGTGSETMKRRDRGQPGSDLLASDSGVAKHFSRESSCRYVYD